MGFHDNLATRAHLSGRTSEEFSVAAQKHANATWFYIAIGAVVWWLTSWVWALIPFAIGALVAIQSASATMTASRLEKIENRRKPEGVQHDEPA